MVDDEGDSKTQSLDQSTGDDVMMGGDNENDDTDVDTDEDEFIPGCYELDVDPNPVSDVSKISTRADYLRVYKYAETQVLPPP